MLSFTLNEDLLLMHNKSDTVKSGIPLQQAEKAIILSMDGAQLQKTFSGEGMPLFVSTGDPDPRVSVSRVSESVMILKNMNGEVNLQVYEGRPHTIAQDEVDRANEMIFDV